MTAPLLIELFTEELPPKSLRLLSEEFANRLVSELTRHQLRDKNATGPKLFATPRRLGVLIPDVQDHGPDTEREVQGPSTSAPKQAVEGFARKSGVAVDALARTQTPKGEVFVACIKTRGAKLGDILGGMVEEALKKLPIPKVMRWGSGEAQFVRPVHGLVVLYGSEVLPATVLGLRSGNVTCGHRFMGPGELTLGKAEDYESRLRTEGRVIADFAKRRAEIDRQLRAGAQKLGARLGEYADLLDEVTALVEHPSVYTGAFDQAFLEVPQECLILTMRQNQKYFPLFGADGALLPQFLIVSNMDVDDPKHIVGGNQRVVRPRLEDARFFYNQDRRVRLEERVPQLGRMVYHNKLGTQLERVQRVQLIAGEIARRLGTQVEHAERAAWLAKADLVTGMVGEFPELQGIMGRYYARHDGEHEAVCNAIGDQYRLRLRESGSEATVDEDTLVSASLYLADRLEALTGLFGIGEIPTGEKDPFALRRAALGVIHAFESLATAGRLGEPGAPDVRDLLSYAAGQFPDGKVAQETVDEVHGFILDRVWNNLASEFSKDAVEAVISQRPRLAEIRARVQAVVAFRTLPEADSLAAANKRIRNILRKSDASSAALDDNLLTEAAEKTLYSSTLTIEPAIDTSMVQRDYAGALKTLAGIRDAVDRFFDEVMVNAEDPRLRANRLALLRRLDALMNRVADISKLAA